MAATLLVVAHAPHQIPAIQRINAVAHQQQAVKQQPMSVEFCLMDVRILLAEVVMVKAM